MQTENLPTTKVALDTNSILSGRRREIAAAAYLGYYQGIWSSWIVAEVVRTRTEWTGRRAVREGASVAETMRRFNASREKINRLIDELSEVLTSVDYREAPADADLSWLTDPDDEAVMQTALAGGAEILVTNDRHFPSGGASQRRFVHEDRRFSYLALRDLSRGRGRR